MGIPMSSIRPAAIDIRSANGTVTPATSRLITRALVAGLILASISLLAINPAAARDATAWKVDQKLLGEAKGPPDFHKSENVSGIACDLGMKLPKLCLVVDDETQGAQIVLLMDDELRAGGFIPLSYAQYAGEPFELDAEGVAFDAGHFYVVGSHGRARHEKNSKKEDKKKAKNNAKAEASRQIFRIALPASAVDMKTGEIIGKADITPSSALAAILQGQPELAPFYDKPLEENGVTIEGIAVRDERLFIGLRGPVLGTDAAVLSVRASAIFDGQPPDAKLHTLPLEKDTLGHPRGIRDLARYRDGFLILAGPVNDPPDDTAIKAGDYAIYFWDRNNKPSRLVNLKSYGKKTKPEALLPLEGDDARIRVLLMFDGPEEGEPTPLEIKLN
jgi:hypothetical protein